MSADPTDGHGRAAAVDNAVAVHIADRYNDPVVLTPAEAREFARAILSAADEADARPSGAHSYLSTGCYHGEHDYCRSMTGWQGEKRPAQCKFCDARCECDCHREEVETP